MTFLQTPHIPDGKVCLCAVGAGHSYIKYALMQRGIQVLELPSSTALDPATANHADMLLHHLGGERLLLAEKNTAFQDELEQYGLRIGYTQRPLEAEYPRDVALNCFVMGNYLFGNKKSIDLKLLKHYQSQGRRVVNVAQGYAKCSVAIVNPYSIITADKSIADAVEIYGIQALRISSGGILLPGYSYGFIGGCCGLLSPKLLAFSGDITAHIDFAAMEHFCGERGVELVALSEGPLVDIGGIIPLAEECAEH